MPVKLDCQVKPAYLSRFEPGKMFRLTEPGKIVRFDPNL